MGRTNVRAHTHREKDSQIGEDKQDQGAEGNVRVNFPLKGVKKGTKLGVRNH